MCIVLTKSKLIGKSSEDAGTNQVGYRTWINEPTDKGDVKLSNYTTSSINLPKASGSSGYWHAYITPYSADLSTLYGTTYSDFKSGNSYNARLESELSRILNAEPALRGQALTKLNVELDGNSIPNPGRYYINATQISTDNNNVKTIYTQDTNTGKMKDIDAVDIYDIIVNNYFHHSIYKKSLLHLKYLLNKPFQKTEKNIN